MRRLMIGMAVAAVCFYAMCQSEPVSATPIQWRVEDGGNGHWYALTQNYGTWEECENEAVAAGGYLADITDASENAWLTEFIRGSVDRGQYARSQLCVDRAIAARWRPHQSIVLGLAEWSPSHILEPVPVEALE